MFEKVVLVMGLFAFAKEAPKLIGDVLGVDSGKMKLGIGGKLAAGGFLGAAAVGIGASRALANNVVAGFAKSKGSITDLKNAKGGKKVGAAFKAAGSVAWHGLLGGAVSGAAGAVSAGVRAVPDGFKAKNNKERKMASDKAAMDAVEARINRDYYQAGHGAIVGSVYGHLQDKVDKAKTWMGIGNIVQRVQFEDKFIAAYEDYKNAFENGEYQAITAEINKYKAAKAAGRSESDFGLSDSFDNAIDKLKAKQKELRVDTLLKKNDAGDYIYKDMAAYMIYNLSNLIQTNSNYAKELGLDTRMTQELAKSITIRDNKILKNGVEMTANEIVDIMEATGYTLDSKGKVASITNAVAKGLYEDRSVADNARKADTSTVAYKEFKRQQEANKK